MSINKFSPALPPRAMHPPPPLARRQIGCRSKLSFPQNCDATLFAAAAAAQPAGGGGEGAGREVGVRRGAEGDETFRREGDGALRYLVDVPFLTSQMLHLNASAVFLKVHTLQSQ